MTDLKELDKLIVLTIEEADFHEKLLKAMSNGMYSEKLIPKHHLKMLAESERGWWIKMNNEKDPNQG